MSYADWCARGSTYHRTYRVARLLRRMRKVRVPFAEVVRRRAEAIERAEGERIYRLWHPSIDPAKLEAERQVARDLLDRVQAEADRAPPLHKGQLVGLTNESPFSDFCIYGVVREVLPRSRVRVVIFGSRAGRATVTLMRSSVYAIPQP